MSDFINQILNQPYLRPVILIALSILLGIACAQIAATILNYFFKRSNTENDDILLAHLRGPAMILLPILILKIVTPAFRVPPPYLSFFNQTLNILFILGMAHLSIKLVFALRSIVFNANNINVADNLRARKISTQVGILVKIAVALIILVAVSMMLMTFSGIRQIGVSILASAGITGIIIGIAAQKTLSNLLAGIQIAITQPIRIDDVVIVEGEWGRIEEINLTFVVVRIWDLRRLVLPISYFIEKPFQNWTRTSADILGSVFIYTDYTVPVEAVRKEAESFLAGCPLWDKKVCVAHVTDTKSSNLEIRLLVSAKDASTAWELRCTLREHMVGFIQKNYPDSFPRTRAEIVSGPESIPKT